MPVGLGRTSRTPRKLQLQRNTSLCTSLAAGQPPICNGNVRKRRFVPFVARNFDIPAAPMRRRMRSVNQLPNLARLTFDEVRAPAHVASRRRNRALHLVLCPIVDCGFDRLDEHQTAGLPRMGKNVFSAIAFKARFRQERRDRFRLTRRPSRHTAGAPNAHQAGHRSCSETRRGTARVGANHRVAAI